ncbi:MAG: indole-3-glycerol phosphate synthase TrpC [Clostridia bacterium]|nr:MAG: indole-3-glycerol phosphate synthase TrpC [Clostridia bacterium]
MLAEILAHKREEVKERSRKVPLAELQGQVGSLPPGRDWEAALNSPGRVQVIAEIKRASPSQGMIRPDLDPVGQAVAYAQGGAAAISVLTDQRYFHGDLDFLSLVRKQVSLPVLEKDFIVSAYQLYEARVRQADAVLLIVAALSAAKLEEYYGLAGSLGLGCLVEVHTEAELERALAVEARVIGINNRNLETMGVDVRTTGRLRSLVPPGHLVVSESGIRAGADMAGLAGLRVHAALVGEALVRAADPGAKLREFLSAGRWPDGEG